MAASNRIPESELILNPDGSVYHLGLRPEHLARIIITVGDPERVQQVSQHFDEITFQVQRREFCSHVGTWRGNRILCISTGIGTDNVDIVLNELDALNRVDFETRTLKQEVEPLTFVRLGTSGALRSEIPLDSLLVSGAAVGLDGLGSFYRRTASELSGLDHAILKNFPFAYTVDANRELVEVCKQAGMIEGVTLTCAGFYGPQGRAVVPNSRKLPIQQLVDFTTNEGRVLTNLEMETAGIYLLANVLGHRAISISAILANRANGEFSVQPVQTVDRMIKTFFTKILATVFSA